MRRYLPTLTLVVILMALGGVGIYQFFGQPVTTQMSYIPTLSADPQAGQTQGLILVGAVVGIIGATLALGAGLAFAFNKVVKFQAALPAEAAAPTSRPAGPAAKPSPGESSGVPLTSQRSLIIFWVIVVGLMVLLVGSNLLAQGTPIGAFHTLDQMAKVELFKLPGEHIKGLPSFIAGPGDPVTALHVFLGVLGGVVVGTAVAGVGLARGLFALDGEMRKPADQRPRTAADRLLASVDARVQDLMVPKPQAARPVNGLDRSLLTLDIVLLLIFVGLLAVWVIPSYGGVKAVDQAVEATKIAASWTPTPNLPPGVSPEQALADALAALPAGDATSGEGLAQTKACAACHLNPTAKVGPQWPAADDPGGEGVATRAAHRFTDPGYTGHASNPQAYLLESITHPEAYVVSGFQTGVMPATFGTSLTKQELADLLAYLETFK